MLDIQLSDRATNLILMILLKQVIRLIIGDVVTLSEIPVDTAFEFSSNSSRLPHIRRIPYIHKQMWIIKIEHNLRSQVRQITFKDAIVVEPIAGDNFEITRPETVHKFPPLFHVLALLPKHSQKPNTPL